MGDYTMFMFDARLRSDTPDEVIERLQYILTPSDFAAEDDDELPVMTTATSASLRHPLFETERWFRLMWSYTAESLQWAPTETFSEYGITTDWLLQCGLTRDVDGTWLLRSATEIKNYDDEIEHFLDWIAPFLASESGEKIGLIATEDNQHSRESTQLFADAGRITRLEPVERQDDSIGWWSSNDPDKTSTPFASADAEVVDVEGVSADSGRKTDARSLSAS